MTESGANIRRHLLPWDRPLPAQAAAWLADGWTGSGPLDLSAVLLVVPTRQSGRRLREALAEHAHGRGRAVLAPRVVLPEDLLAGDRGVAEVRVASRLETQLAWIDVLRAAPLEEFRAVFPVDPPVRNFSWAMRLAAQLTRLQSTLAENGLSLRDVAPRAGAGLPEGRRWEQLGRLEQLQQERLRAAGRRSPQARLIAGAFQPICPPEIKRIVLLATPDPFPLAVVALEILARSLPLDVVLYGPAGGEGEFDEWGRPRPTWRTRRMELDFENQVRLCLDPAEQAREVAELARRYGTAEGRLAIGVGDPEVAPALENRLRAAGVATFNPGGRSRRRDGFYALLATLGNLVREPAFDVAQALGRCPDFLAWMAHDEFSPAVWLRELDELQQRHLPATIEGALRHAAGRPTARRGLEAMLGLRAQLTRGRFPDNAAGVLRTLFAGRRWAADSELGEAAEAWMELLREAAAAEAVAAGVNDADWWELALGIYGDGMRVEPRPAGAVDLLGWLELLWESAPHVVVAGLNDGRIPETVIGDAFLPDALRARLGLPTNDARLARDVYLLGALAASRRERGRLDLLVGKVSLAGDPLRPSRLLLLCDDTELPARVTRLFRPVGARRASLPWRRAWKLQPPLRPPPSRVSVTAFRDYLRCPFRFYLKHLLRMEAFDPFKSELDAFDFGTLCHAALEQMGLDAQARELTDARALREFLLARLDRDAQDRFGRELTLPLIVQLESARQRLGRAAEVQAAERALGWRVESVERKFELNLGPLTVSGRIDRIERHLEGGAVRVIDYKTSDQAITPAAAHVRLARRDETAPEWARFRAEGKELVWIDLQLPLYLEALAGEFGGAVTAGYFNLPKAVGETALVSWKGYDDVFRAAARRCAEGIAQAVVAGVFWPPAEISPRDEDDRFAGLFHHGTAASVDWRGAS